MIHYYYATFQMGLNMGPQTFLLHGNQRVLVGSPLACGLIGPWFESMQILLRKSICCDIGLGSCETVLPREKDGKCIA
jgi:hypothetical protein